MRSDEPRALSPQGVDGAYNKDEMRSVVRSSVQFERCVLMEPPWLADSLEVSAEVRHAIFADGVPKSFIGRRYFADHAVALLERVGEGRILRFGSSGVSSAIGVNLATGIVVEAPKSTDAPSLFVNTSLMQFSRTIEAMISRFPYYDSDSGDAEFELVARELLGIVQQIDPAAAIPDRYWSTFVDDVEIGDLTTEAILAMGE